MAASAKTGRFTWCLAGQKVAAARDVAELIARGVSRRSRPSAIRRAAFIDDRDRALARSAFSPSSSWNKRTKRLAIAHQSGGDCAIDQDAFAQELASWRNELAAGNPLANVTAQDIMEPFPAVLERESADPAMLAALRRGESPVWPFVDRDGQLVGVASPESPADATAIWPADAAAGQALVTPVTIAHDAAFPEIYEAFSSQGCMTMVVVGDGRPVGYLTCGGFLSLIEPIMSATYASDELGAGRFAQPAGRLADQ